MILVVLAVIWIAVLTPSLVRSRAQRRGADSIGAFHRQLGVIERTGSALIPLSPRRQSATAARRAAMPAPAGVTAAGPHRAGVRTPTRNVARQLAALSSAGRPAPVPVKRAGAPAAQASSRSAGRQQMLRRRRDVLVALAFGLVATILIGALPPLRFAWALTGVLAILLISYVAMLIRCRNLAAERAMKLAFFPAPPEAHLVLQRSASN